MTFECPQCDSEEVTLQTERDALKQDAQRWRKLCEILQTAYDSESFESGRLTIYCEQLSGWRNERTVEARMVWIDARDADLDLGSAIDATLIQPANPPPSDLPSHPGSP